MGERLTPVFFFSVEGGETFGLGLLGPQASKETLTMDSGLSTLSSVIVVCRSIVIKSLASWVSMMRAAFLSFWIAMGKEEQMEITTAGMPPILARVAGFMYKKHEHVAMCLKGWTSRPDPPFRPS